MRDDTGGATPRPEPRWKAAVALARKGHSAREIAAELALPNVRSVHCMLCYARNKKGETLPLAGQPGGAARSTYAPRLRLSPDERIALEAAARSRGQEPCDLAQKILSAVLADGLVDAVLDDREGAPT